MSILYYFIDEETRKLRPEAAHKVVAQKDHNADVIRVGIPETMNSVDLETSAVRCMYQRPKETEVRSKTATYYNTSGGYLWYDWTLQEGDTVKAGKINFSVCLQHIEDGLLTVDWNTTIGEIHVKTSYHSDDSDEADETITSTVAQRVAVLEAMTQRLYSMAGGAPVVVSSVSEMTDTAQIYVLTTDGYWYYHDGSAWTAGGEYGAVSTDRTLSMDGIPADAKAVGDALAAAGSVTTEKLADGAVTTAKIADRAITADKLSSDIVFETDKTLSVSDMPADAKVTGESVAGVASLVDNVISLKKPRAFSIYPGYYTSSGTITTPSVDRKEVYTSLIPISEGETLNYAITWAQTNAQWAAIAKFDANRQFLTRATLVDGRSIESYESTTVQSGEIAYVAFTYRTYGDAQLSVFTDWNELEDRLSELSDDISSNLDLSTAWENIELTTGTRFYDYSDGYIPVNASTINIDSVRKSSIYKYAVVPCQAADIFWIKGHSGSSTIYSLWSFVDANGNKLDYSANANYDEARIIKAPANSAYLVSNVDRNYPYKLYKGALLIDEFESYKEKNTKFIEDISHNTSITNYVDGYIATNHATIDINTIIKNSTFKCIVVPCTSGEVFSVMGKSGASIIYVLWAFVDASGTMLDRSGVVHYTDYTAIQAPANSAYLVSNADVSEPYGIYRGRLLVNRVEALESAMGSVVPTGLNNPLLRPCAPRIAMHRGFSTQAPENTTPAFELAGKAGAWGIETDIYETTDGYFVLSHDNDVSRMTDGTGKITEMTYAQTQECTIDAGANVDQYQNLKMPTLQEYLAICRRYGCVAFAEIKGITHYDALIDVIRKAGMESSVVFLCYYSLSEVNAIRANTGAPIALLGSANADMTVLTNHAADNTDVWIDIYSTKVTADVLEYAHAKNIPVAGWTYGTSAGADAAVRRGLDIVTADGFAKIAET